MKTDTMEIRILRLLMENTLIHSFGGPMTCAEICRSLAEKKRMASISSCLKKMFDRGQVSRQHGLGPRAGCGYEITDFGIGILLAHQKETSV